MGSHHPQPPRSRRHVLVLLPSRPRRPDLVETIHHDAPNCPIHPRSRLRLFRFLYLFLQHLFPQPTNLRQVRGRGVCSVRGDGHLVVLSAPVHIILFGDV